MRSYFRNALPYFFTPGVKRRLIGGRGPAVTHTGCVDAPRLVRRRAGCLLRLLSTNTFSFTSLPPQIVEYEYNFSTSVRSLKVPRFLPRPGPPVMDIVS